MTAPSPPSPPVPPRSTLRDPLHRHGSLRLRTGLGPPHTGWASDGTSAVGSAVTDIVPPEVSGISPRGATLKWGLQFTPGSSGAGVLT